MTQTRNVTVQTKPKMGSLWSLFCENSGVDPDGSQKSGTNYPSSADQCTVTPEQLDTVRIILVFDKSFYL